MATDSLYVVGTAIVVIVVIRATRTIGKDLRLLLNRLNEVLAILHRQEQKQTRDFLDYETLLREPFQQRHAR